MRSWVSCRLWIVFCILACLGFGCASSDDINVNGGTGTNTGEINGGGNGGGGGGNGGENGNNSGEENGGYQLPEDHATWDAEDWARARITHVVSTEEAFDHISNSTGFPVHTKEGKLIFMHWWNEGNWSLAGDLNHWEKQSMTRDGDVSYIETENSIASENIQRYKFVNTDTNTYMADPWAMYYDYDENGEISYVKAPKNQSYQMRWKAFKSPQGLKQRTLRAWIPASSGPYKVLYAQDGQSLFDLDNGNGGWRLRSNLKDIGADFIVVGIDSVEDKTYEYDRMNEYIHVEDSFEGRSYAPKGDIYADFVENTVRPMIESRFETTQIAGVMGASLGGLISLYIAHKYPGRYQAVLALSPTTAWGDFSSHNKTIEKIYVEDGFRENLLLYLDSGGNEGSGCKYTSEDAWEDEYERDNYCYTRHFVDTMDEIGYTWRVNLFHYFDMNAAHNEEAWAKRIADPLGYFKAL